MKLPKFPRGKAMKRAAFDVKLANSIEDEALNLLPWDEALVILTMLVCFLYEREDNPEKNMREFLITFAQFVTTAIETGQQYNEETYQ